MQQNNKEKKRWEIEEIRIEKGTNLEIEEICIENNTNLRNRGDLYRKRYKSKKSKII